jgi:peptidoglycan/LPS O-acetylase OafA/YrhL
MLLPLSISFILFVAFTRLSLARDSGHGGWWSVPLMVIAGTFILACLVWLFVEWRKQRHNRRQWEALKTSLDASGQIGLRGKIRRP